MPKHTVALSDIVKAIFSAPISLPLPDVQIAGLQEDSRKAKPDQLFLLSKQEAAPVKEDALRKGVRFFLQPGTKEDICLNRDHLTLQVVDYVHALRTVYGLFYPVLPSHRVAITGTDGKTSTAHFLYQLWCKQGIRAALLGTIGGCIAGESMYDTEGMTTPARTKVFDFLKDCVWHNVDHVCLEMSSHALCQDRVYPLSFHTSIFTTFSQDHLDYHKTVDAYWESKLKLFTHYTVRNMVLFHGVPLNANHFPLFNVLRYGPESILMREGMELTYKIIEHVARGHLIELALWQNGTCKEKTLIRFPLLGTYQIHNALAAMGTLLINDQGTFSQIAAHMATLSPVKGRLEYAGSHNGADIFIDYAHTPQGLDESLCILSQYGGKLGLVFGCGGDRDVSKRALMGSIAHEKADWVVVTDDNPRSENPEAIRAHIIKGCPGALNVADRADAIMLAIKKLDKGDVLLIAGKGHETCQIFADRIIPFSDISCVKACLVSLNHNVSQNGDMQSVL